MSLLHPRRAAEADRSRLRSYDQARTTAVGRRQAGVIGQGTDRPRAAVCGDMRKRPAAQAPRPAATAAAQHRQVTIGTVRAAEPHASLEENAALFKAALSGPAAHVVRMMLMPHAARIAELAGPRRCLTADGEVYR